MNKNKCNFCNRFSSSAHKCIPKQPLAERIWKYIERTPDCWIWRGAKDSLGYGRIGADFPEQKILLSHRAMWSVINGKIPDGLCVLHKCDNPSCVSPAHLFIGTMKDNSVDMAKKSRWGNKVFPGESHGQHKLTNEIVLKLRLRHADGGITYKQLGQKFGINSATAFGIVKRKAWKHI